jgi:hypothetical protein
MEDMKQPINESTDLDNVQSWPNVAKLSFL